MPKIPLKFLPAAVIQAILHPDPLTGEDIQIEDDDGNLLAAIIPASAYRFFLQKVGEREDEIDSKVAEDYDPNAKTLNDFMKVVEVARNQSLANQRATLYHELVHRYLSPRVGPFLRLRAELGFSAYARSVLLRYLEEALAEGISKLRTHGFAQAFEALRFPIQAGYMTVSQIIAEGSAIGTITLGGLLFRVYISLGPIPHHD